MSKSIKFPNEATMALKETSKFKEYTRKMESMSSKEEFVKTILLLDCISFMETQTGETLKNCKITLTWDEKEWERVCKETPFVKDSFGACQFSDKKIVKMIVKPETAERWIESWFPQLYFFRFIIHELFHVLFPEKSDKEVHKFTDLVAMERFWDVEFSNEIKFEIQKEIEKQSREN